MIYFFRSGTNTLGIIFFCLVFGTVVGTMGKKAHMVVEFFTIVDEVVMKIVSGVIWYEYIDTQCVWFKITLYTEINKL
jgi:Na+/H+-dicarboxylate symporter